MDRHHELLQTAEVYSHCIDMIQKTVVGIRHEIAPIKKFIGDRKKEIIKFSAKANKHEQYTLGCTRAFYEYTLKELMSMEEACEECILKLKTDLLTATKDRMQPPSYLSSKEMNRSYEICCDALNRANDKVLSSCYTWENIPVWNLEDTRNVIAKPPEFMRTQFDESDLKFKHEMVHLRSKMFSLPKKRNDSGGNEIISESMHGFEVRSVVKLSLHPKAFMKVLRRNEAVHHFSILEELSKVGSLKFVDGHFKNCDVWSKILDVYGNQYGTRWNLVVRPQIERMMKKRLIPVLHLKPRKTFNFLTSIEGNGADLVLERQDLIDLVGNKTEVPWLESWELQFRTIEGANIAATLIQARWRGYMLRKMKRESDRLYIAASYVWFTWLSLKQKKEIHKRYLQKMLISLQTTRELSLKLSKEFDSMILEPHVVIHLPSIGNPLEVRQTFDPMTFRMMQNISSLRISMVRNPKTEVIYVLPVKPTEDLLMMYSDFIESMSPSEDVAKRITFIALSQLETFKHRPINTARVLHCSEDSLQEIRKKIAGKSAFFLPWFVDECDMRLAGNLGIPMLSPGMELQRAMLNSSEMTEMIEKLGLLQPIHARDIKDYKTLCSTMADFIVLHTEVCIWWIKLNYGILNNHSGVFLINHISVPFMPLLRREREKHGNTWMECPSLREEFHQKLMEHLPKVVSNVTRLTKSYKSWKEFYVQIQKYGCLLQAIPMEKDSKTITVALFLSGRATGNQPRWIGTADKLSLDSDAFSTFMYMMPQSSLDIKKLESSVNKFAMGMQNEGYFGYLTVDCYCYTNKSDDEFMVLMQNVRPSYSFVQSYIDWMKFAIGGAYNPQTNQFIADVPVIADAQRRKSSILFPHKSPEWNETKERCGVIIGLLYDTRFSAYRWPQLRNILEQCNITFDAKKKQGSSVILHDNEIRNFGLMMAAGPCMAVTLSTLHNRLTKLNEALAIKSKRKYETNLPALIDFFSRLALDYENLAVDECIPISLNAATFSIFKMERRLRHHANDNDNKVSPFVNFIIGGLSGAAGQTATHPFDVFKVRMQVSKTSLTQTIRDSLKHVGIRSFYIGWTASILRQLTYSTARLGMYTTLYDLAQGYFGRLNYPTMVSIGMLSGVVGAFVGTPTDLVLIRMIADVNLPPEKRKNYKNAVVGLIDIWKTEGTRGLWRGAVPTMTRAAIVNGTQLGTYSRAKLMLMDTGHFEEGVLLQFLAAMISGLVMCTASLPVDVAKTRIQNWNLPTKPPGIVSMMISIVQNEGVTSLWRGFLPYYCRAAPNAVITMICMDQLHRMYLEFFKPSTE